MSDDLVKRLRDRRVCSLAQNSCRNDWVCEQAADRIEELERMLGLVDDQRREWERHCKKAEAKLAECEARLAKAVEALTPSGETKAAYIAEVKTDCPSGQAHTVSWTATKEIMKMIRHFAELKGPAVK